MVFRADVLDNVRRDTDIDGFQPTGDRSPWKQDMPDFGKSESDRGVGLNAGPADHCRVCTQTGGDVYGDDRSVQTVHQVDHRPEKTFDFGIEPGSQKRIHPDAVVTHGRAMLRQGRGIRNRDNRNFQRSQQLQIGCGIAFDSRTFGKEINGNGCPHAVEIPGDDEPVSAVVSPSGYNAHMVIANIRKCFGDNVDNTSAGVFHQNPARKPEGFDGFPVHPLHFRSRDNHLHRKIP